MAAYESVPPRSAAATRPVTTARMISPWTSSMIAAPRMIRASLVCDRPRSFRTRAVIPTLVAVSVAPRKIWAYAPASGISQCANSPAEHERPNHAQRRDQQRRQSDLQHLADRRFEADLKQQQDDTQLRQQVDRRVGLQVFEAAEAGQREIAEQHPGRQFTEHGRLAKPGGEMAANLGSDEDDRK